MNIPSPFDHRVSFACAAHRATELFEFEPEEIQIAPKGGSKSRRIEFLLGRRAAVAALLRAGVVAPSAPPRLGRIPLWPEGMCGSISHTDFGGWVRACAGVALVSDIAALGVDVEGLRSISPRALRRFACGEELSWVEKSDSERRSIAVFSAREALFKAIYPHYRHPMRYRETHLRWSDELHGFSAKTELPALGAPPIESSVTVRFEGDVVVAGVVLERSALPPL